MFFEVSVALGKETLFLKKQLQLKFQTDEKKKRLRNINCSGNKYDWMMKKEFLERIAWKRYKNVTLGIFLKSLTKLGGFCFSFLFYFMNSIFTYDSLWTDAFKSVFCLSIVFLVICYNISLFGQSGRDGPGPRTESAEEGISRTRSFHWNCLNIARKVLAVLQWESLQGNQDIQ